MVVQYNFSSDFVLDLKNYIFDAKGDNAIYLPIPPINCMGYEEQVEVTHKCLKI